MTETEAGLKTLDAAEFSQALTHTPGLLLVDYVTDHCVWCTRLEPVLLAAQAQYLDRVTMVKVDVERHPQTAPEGGIRATPTVALYRDGRLLMSKSGMMQRGALLAFLDHWLDPANEGL